VAGCCIEWLLYSSNQVNSQVNRQTVGKWTSEWTSDILMIDEFMNGGKSVSLLDYVEIDPWSIMTQNSQFVSHSDGKFSTIFFVGGVNACYSHTTRSIDRSTARDRLCHFCSLIHHTNRMGIPVIQQKLHIHAFHD
jgi:hypothetical protein